MRTLRLILSTNIGSALAGGLVVLLGGIALIETGIVDASDNSSAPTVTPASLARPVSDSQGLTVNEIYERDAEGVAFIRAETVQQGQAPLDLFPQEQQSVATGSGFLIDDEGHILTNSHVVEGARKVEVELGGGESQEAEVIGTDPSTDIALLKVEDTKGIEPLELGDSSKVEVGDPVVAIGNPFALDRTVTSGIVSALQRQIQAPNGFSISNVIQTDAAINPGNSGGPLIDGSGRVIGINSQIESQSGGNDGVGFAVPIETAQDVVEQLLNDGEVRRAYLGITGGELTPEAARALELRVDQGVLVERVLSGGPADEAGIQGSTGETTIGGQTYPTGGDVITRVDGEEVTGMEEVISAVNEKKPGDEITLTVVNADGQRDVPVKLGDRPANAQDPSESPSAP